MHSFLPMCPKSYTGQNILTSKKKKLPELQLHWPFFLGGGGGEGGTVPCLIHI